MEPKTNNLETLMRESGMNLATLKRYLYHPEFKGLLSPRKGERQLYTDADVALLRFVGMLDGLGAVQPKTAAPLVRFLWSAERSVTVERFGYPPGEGESSGLVGLSAGTSPVAAAGAGASATDPATLGELRELAARLNAALARFAPLG